MTSRKKRKAISEHLRFDEHHKHTFESFIWYAHNLSNLTNFQTPQQTGMSLSPMNYRLPWKDCLWQWKSVFVLVSRAGRQQHVQMMLKLLKIRESVNMDVGVKWCKIFTHCLSVAITPICLQMAMIDLIALHSLLQLSEPFTVGQIDHYSLIQWRNYNLYIILFCIIIFKVY